MQIRNWLPNFFRRNNIFGFGQVIGNKSEQWVSVDGHELELYLDVPELFTVINRKASMYSNMRIKHIRLSDKSEIENSDIVKFLDNPNPLQSRNEFFSQRLIALSLFGNSFVNKNVGSFGNIGSMYVLPSSKMAIERTGKLWKQMSKEDIILNYKLQLLDGIKQIFEVDEVWHSINSNPEDPIMGISPLISLTKPLSNIKGAYETRNILIYNKGAMGVLSNKSSSKTGGALPLKEDERKKIEKQYQKNYGIGVGKSNLIISNAGLEWTPISYPTKDLMLFEEIDNDLLRIIDIYGLNSNMFSTIKGSTFNNVKEGVKQAYQDTIIPQAKDDLKKLSAFLGLDIEKEILIPDYSHIPILAESGTEKADELEKRSNIYSNLITSGMSDEEALMYSGLDVFLEGSI